MRIVRLGAVPCLVALLAAALGTALGETVQAAPAAQARARVAVAVFPDLAAVEDEAAECLGCDGQYTVDDTEANAGEPLGVMEVSLIDEDGREIDRNRTSGLANGRQVTFFSVESARVYSVKIVELPEGWQMCPDLDLALELTADDFDTVTGIANARFFVWRGCPEPEQADGDEEGAEAEAAKADLTTADADAVEPQDEAATTQEHETAAAPEDDAEAEEAEATAVIRGVVFVDADEDGTLDEGEAGLPGASLRLVGLGESRETESAGAGTYAFGSLVEGSYDVYLEAPDGYDPTTVDRYIGLEVESDVVQGMNFGLVVAPGEVAGSGEPESAAIEAEEAVTATAEVTLVSGADLLAPALPSTGVQVRSGGGLLAVLAAAIGLLGLFGLALEARLGRRSYQRAQGGDHA